MNLPMPNRDDILKFKEWHDRERGGDISMKDAQSTYTDLLHFYYLIGGHEVSKVKVIRGRKGSLQDDFPAPPLR